MITSHPQLPSGATEVKLRLAQVSDHSVLLSLSSVFLRAISLPSSSASVFFKAAEPLLLKVTRNLAYRIRHEILQLRTSALLLLKN